MLVRVKQPHIEVTVRGDGADKVCEALQHAFQGAEVEEEDEYVPIEETDWYRSRAGVMTSGKSMRIYRENAKMTLTRLAVVTGIPKGNLSQMEHDKRAIGPLTAKKLAKALGCDYRSLL